MDGWMDGEGEVGLLTGSLVYGKLGWRILRIAEEGRGEIFAVRMEVYLPPEEGKKKTRKMKTFFSTRHPTRGILFFVEKFSEW